MLTDEWARELDCERTVRHVWSKQRQTLFELREGVLKRIHAASRGSSQTRPTEIPHVLTLAAPSLETHGLVEWMNLYNLTLFSSNLFPVNSGAGTTRVTPNPCPQSSVCVRRSPKECIRLLTTRPLIGVNFFPFLQAQGDRHRLA